VGALFVAIRRFRVEPAGEPPKGLRARFAS